MDSLDTSWCPTCDRQIIPKRIDVPVVAQNPAPAPAPVPAPPPVARTKSNNGRARGLVHGTGRARPAVKRVSSKKDTAAVVAPLATVEASAQPPAPVKTKSVIDQTPLPLYCSDDCRLLDLHRFDDGFSYNYNPERDVSPAATTVSPSVEPHSPLAASDSESASTSSSYPHSHASARSYGEMDPSIAILAAAYNFPALPPPPPLLPLVPVKPTRNPADEYVSGIMMAGRRINETLCPPTPKRSSFSSPSARYTASLSRDRQPIPGWTDGSDAWRASVYSLSDPKTMAEARRDADARSAVYKTTVATPHRSSGVVSTLGEGPSAQVAEAVAAVRDSRPSPDAITELYGNYPMFNSARADSRIRMYGSSASLPNRASSSLSTRITREVGILPKQAEGKLLVPNVKLRRTTSTASVATVSSIGSYYGPRSPRSLTRRGSGMSDDVITEECEDGTAPRTVASTTSLPVTRPTPARKPTDEYLYPIMLPMVRQKRIERQIVDGVERDVEVEVMVPKEVERLFLGPDGVSEQRVRRRQAAAAAIRAQVAAARA